MGTPLCEIVYQAMITIGDYKLDRIAQVDPETFGTIIEGYMVRGVSKFEGCLKPLNYSRIEHCFYADLDMFEVDIVASLVVIEWYERQLQDILQFVEPLKNADFAKYSTGQNLRPRQEYIAELRRKVKQDITNYQCMHIDELPYFQQVGGSSNVWE